MVHKWKEKKLEEVCEAIIDYRGKTPRKTLFGIPLITARMVKNGKIDYSKQEYIDADNYDKWMVRGLPHENDVVITTEAPLGEVAQLDGRKIALAQRIIALRGKKGILDNNYLRYILQTKNIQGKIHARESGTTVQGIKQSELRKIELPIPEFDIQKKLGKYLRSLDDSIETLEHLDKIIEKIIQSIFKSWFVDFDGQTEFVDSELGKIPKGWEVCSLKEILALLKDGSHNPPKRVKTGIKFIAGASDLKHFEVDFTKCSHITKDEYDKIHKNWEIKSNDILLTIVGTIGNIGIVKKSDLPFSLQRSIAVLRSNEKIDFVFLYCVLNTEEFRQFLYANINPTGQPGIYLGTLSEFRMILPPHDLIEKFGTIAQPIILLLQTNYENIKKLTKIRDALLPKLISGKIQV